MSTILKALRRLEEEKAANEEPRPLREQIARAPGALRSRRTGWIAAAIALVLGIGAGGGAIWWLFGGESAKHRGGRDGARAPARAAPRPRRRPAPAPPVRAPVPGPPDQAFASDVEIVDRPEALPRLADSEPVQPGPGAAHARARSGPWNHRPRPSARGRQRSRSIRRPSARGAGCLPRPCRRLRPSPLSRCSRSPRRLRSRRPLRPRPNPRAVPAPAPPPPRSRSARRAGAGPRAGTRAQGRRGEARAEARGAEARRAARSAEGGAAASAAGGRDLGREDPVASARGSPDRLGARARRGRLAARRRRRRGRRIDRVGDRAVGRRVRARRREDVEIVDRPEALPRLADSEPVQPGPVQPTLGYAAARGNVERRRARATGGARGVSGGRARAARAASRGRAAVSAPARGAGAGDPRGDSRRCGRSARCPNPLRCRTGPGPRPGRAERPVRRPAPAPAPAPEVAEAKPAPKPAAPKPAAPRAAPKEAPPPPPPPSIAISVEKTQWHPLADRRIAWVRVPGEADAQRVVEGDVHRRIDRVGDRAVGRRVRARRREDPPRPRPADDAARAGDTRPTVRRVSAEGRNPPSSFSAETPTRSKSAA